MISKLNFRKIIYLGILVLFTGLTGCKDMFKDPLVDKKTGDKVTLLLLDRSFINTKLSISLVDANTQLPIESESVSVSFSGADAANLITFGGYKQTTFHTGSGYIEVGYDPNADFGAQNPLELTIMASSQNYISAPQFLSYTTEGIKNLVIKMVPKTSLKSAKLGSYTEPYDISYNGHVQSTDLVYVADFSGFPTGTAWSYLNLYTTNSNGNLLCNNLKDNVLYADYGVYYFREANGVSLMPPSLPIKNSSFQKGDYVYSAILNSGMSKCDNGLTIHIERNDNSGGSGVFDYLMTFSDGSTKTGQISCTFPSDNLIEQIYYPSANPAVKVELLGDAQYDFSQAVNLTSPCGAKANFTATPKSNLKTFKMITRYSCPENSIGLGLTIIGEFRLKGSTDKWTPFKFVEGVCELQLVANADYDFRVNIDSEYYNYILPTNPDKVKTYLEDNSSPDFKFRNLSILSTDAGVTISTDVQFSNSICDIINNMK